MKSLPAFHLPVARCAWRHRTVGEPERGPAEASSRVGVAAGAAQGLISRDSRAGHLRVYRRAVVAAGKEYTSPAPPWRHRFLAGYTWLILKNVLGWLLILASFVAGPLVPGPGGIPLFLIGFALVSFPGKRRLTARVLRGRPLQFPRRPFMLISVFVALAVPALVLALAQRRSAAVAGLGAGTLPRTVALFSVGAAVTWLLVRWFPWALNLLLRLVARGRRRFRPWLRHHRIRLLPPRWRRRHPHEAGVGPFRLKDEILKFSRRGGRRG